MDKKINSLCCKLSRLSNKLRKLTPEQQAAFIKILDDREWNECCLDQHLDAIINIADGFMHPEKGTPIPELQGVLLPDDMKDPGANC